MTSEARIVSPVAPDFDMCTIEGRLAELHEQHPISFESLTAVAMELGLTPPQFAILFETVEIRDREGGTVTPGEVWSEAIAKYRDVMQRAVRKGITGENDMSFLKGDWGQRLSGHISILGAGWVAFVKAIAVQEFNAGMGLVSAAPTGGASGTVPGTIVAASDALGAELGEQVEALLVAGLVGRVAIGRGPVSGAQAGCGGEVGVAASMAAGGVVHMLGGSWEEIAAAASLAGVTFVGLECSPTQGLVEYPCVPRNGFGALCAIAAAEAACGGIRPPYSADDTFDRIFAIGRLLPASLRETNDGHWAAPACRAGDCGGCPSSQPEETE